MVPRIWAIAFRFQFIVIVIINKHAVRFFLITVMIQHLEIKQDPVHLRPGTLATFTCEGGSSNPLVKLNWCKNNTPVPNGINSFSKPGLYGGRISIVQLTLNITSAMDGVNYTCQGSHPVLNKNIYREHTVNVLRESTITYCPFH